jgi:hypothetical protein
MARHDPNPFADEEINPFANHTSVPPASNSYLKPLPPEPYDRGATVDIPLDSGNVRYFQYLLHFAFHVYSKSG